MTWLRNRFLLLSYVALLASFVIVGCTSKEDPNEVLDTCGEHSCGELTMLTTDTSSAGYHYLNPSLSPDGTRVLFTADWNALPSDPKDPGDAYFVNYRQMVILPLPGEGDRDPEINLLSQDAELVRLMETQIQAAGGFRSLSSILDDPKSDPIWEDDNTLIYCLDVNQLGLRIFRAHLDQEGPQPGKKLTEPLYLEPSDNNETPRSWQHLNPNLSHDKRWLLFTHTGCAIADSFETCSNLSIYVMDMETAGDAGGYGAVVRPLTNEYTRIERPRFSRDGTQIVFSSGLDVDGGNGVGTEIYTMDFDAAAVEAGTHDLDHNIQRVTYTSLAEGDPISGILNSDPSFSPDGSTIYFVSTRRAPTTTLHERNIWRVPASGSQDPEIHFFSRFDDLDPLILDDGRILMSSMVGFPTSMLDRLENEAYQTIKDENIRDHATDPDNVPLLNEIELNKQAKAARDDLKLFGGVMAHLYLFR